MNARRIGTVLAVGLFALALSLAFRPPAGKRADGGERKPSTVEVAAPPTPSEAGPGGQTPSSIPPLPPGASPAATGAVTQAGTPPPGPGDPPVAETADGGDRAAVRDPQVDVGKVRGMVRAFHTLTGENPVGTNAEILQTLTGGNAKQARLGPPEGLSLNAKGELVDQWSTPYFFHQLSKDAMEIRSAGPDKTMWTADDVVVR